MAIIGYITKTVELADYFVVDPNEGWNAGAISIALLDADATYRFSTGTRPSGVITGISAPEANVGYGYQEIQYAFYVYGASYRIVESGVMKTAAAAVTNGNATLFSISRIGSTVYYYVDGALVYTSATPITAPFTLVDASLYAGGDSIQDAEITEVYVNSVNVSSASVLATTPTVTRPMTAAVSTKSVMAAGVQVGNNEYMGANFVGSSALEADSTKTEGMGVAVFASATTANATMRAPHNDGANIVLSPLESWANETEASESNTAFEAISAEGYGGDILKPSYSVSDSSLAGIVTAGAMLTGEIATGQNAALEPLDTISADFNYGESETSFYGMFSKSGVLVPVDGFLVGYLPAVDILANGFKTDEQSLIGTVPTPTLTAYSGSGLVKSVPKTAITASGTVPNIGRVYGTAPQVTLAAAGLTGQVGRVNATYYPQVTGTGYFGGYAQLSVPKTSTTASGTIGSAGVLIASAPKVTLTAVAEPLAYGVAILNVPVPTSLYGVARLTVPQTTLTATGYDADGIGVSYAINADNAAVSRYRNYHFDFVFRFNGTYYGISSDVIYALEGNDDAGTKIDAAFEPTPTSRITERTGSETKFKRMPAVRISGRADKTIRVIAKNDETEQYRIDSPALDRKGTHVRRCKLARGEKGHYWTVRVENRSGDELDVDYIEYELEKLSRTV